MNQVSKFFYFMWNHWSKETCVEIYGTVLGEHFWSKFSDYAKRGNDYAISRLYAEMTGDNRDKLLNAALAHYANE